ncbi:MAG: DUF6428 family protein [Bacteroidetes bacterium]|nr:DUF6428 family protein [Bacteroidota bacterium]
MKLSQIKNILTSLEAVNFELPDGTMVPVHYHVTEVGQITKNFIDCGGTIRQEKKVNFQLWEANDTDHRLAAQKLLKIIALSEKALNIEDAEVEVEYQTTTIGKYGVEFNGKNFELVSLSTACLASDSCGIPAEKMKLNLVDLGAKESSCCAPGGGCC